MMNIDRFFKNLIEIFRGDKRTSRSEAVVHQNAMLMGRLLRMVEHTDENELACDDVFDLLDLYVECEARSEDVATLLPLVVKHLERCRDCNEEYEALARILQASLQIGT